uniref:Uncharacterized protein n=1 Tax=Anguilla anguilla TaxID=7936 RepID=A0A0E9PV89_ANGAN
MDMQVLLLDLCGTARHGKGAELTLITFMLAPPTHKNSITSC